MSKTTEDSKKGKHQYLRFRTRRSSNYNWFKDLFYPEGIKRVPKAIDQYHTPRVFAYWIMNEGGYHVSGLILHTNPKVVFLKKM